MTSLTRGTLALGTLAVCLALVSGCSCSTGDNPNGDAGMAMDTNVAPLMDGNGFDVNAPRVDAFAGIDGNGFDVNAPFPDTGSMSMVDAFGPDGNGFDVGPGGCFQATCQSHLYQCGNCLDDDGDGLIDALDPDCLGPCGNNEAGFDPAIPGISLTNCTADCFYDQDGGNGNDGCTYDYRCDPRSPDVNPGGPGGLTRCAYDAARVGTSQCPATQPMMCHDVCGPLTPNGCDCFGCCEITPGSGDYVFVGSVPDAGHPPCSRDSLSDPASCRPCTPVMDCLNTCEHCELCFGRSTLPADCFPPPPVDAAVPPVDANIPDAPYPDGGHPDAYVPPVDAYVPPMDANTPPRCTGTAQPCGLPTDPVCPAGEFCITGCCQFFG